MFCITQTYQNNRIIVTVNSHNKDPIYNYAFYVYVNHKCIHKKMYSSINKYTLDTSSMNGFVYFICYIKDTYTNQIHRYTLDPIKLPRVSVDINDVVFNDSLDVNLKTDKCDIPMRFVKKNDANKLFVLFNGAVRPTAQKKYYPYFSRISWENKFNGHCLYLYDASLDMKNGYVLGWYRGSTEKKLHDSYVSIIEKAIKDLEIDYADVVFYGSSGGGFAALKFAEDIKGVTAVAINPQTDILNYEVTEAVQNFKEIFDVQLNRKSTVVDASCFKPSGSRILLVQNIQDHHHYEEHFKPFWRKLSFTTEGWDIKFHNYALIYDHESGHGGEPPEIFEKIQRIINSNFNDL